MTKNIKQPTKARKTKKARKQLKEKTGKENIETTRRASPQNMWQTLEQNDLEKRYHYMLHANRVRLKSKGNTRQAEEQYTICSSRWY